MLAIWIIFVVALVVLITAALCKAASINSREEDMMDWDRDGAEHDEEE